MDLLRRHVLAPVLSWIRALEDWLLNERRALRGLAATRILVGIGALGILLSSFPARHVAWGPGSFWAEPMRETDEFSALTGLFATDSAALFTLEYLVLIAVAVGFILGWRTRVMNVVLVLGMTGLVERTAMLGNQGDNIMRIGLTLLIFMSVAEHWSLDARRRARGRERLRAGERLSLLHRLHYGLPVLPTWWTTLLHNVLLIALAAQVFILYTASALYKVQGDLWQSGTGLYYPLSLPEFGVFPGLNELLTANPYLLTVMTYFSVFVQLFFAVGLLHPVTRRLFLLGVIGLHGGIAVLMGIPWFSLAMLAYDAIFVTDRNWRAIERAVRGGVGRVRRRGPAAASDDDEDDSPPLDGRPDDPSPRRRETIAERRAGQPSR